MQFILTRKKHDSQGENIETKKLSLCKKSLSHVNWPFFIFKQINYHYFILILGKIDLIPYPPK